MNRVKLIGLLQFVGVALFAQNVVNSNEVLHFELSISFLPHLVGVILLTLGLFCYAKWGVKRISKEYIKLVKILFIIVLPFLPIVLYFILFVVLKDGQQPIDKVIDCIPFSGCYSLMKAAFDLDSVNDNDSSISVDIKDSPGSVVVTTGRESRVNTRNNSNNTNNTKES